ncbi:hypothetical protein BHM03_00059459 [Ensete ventricosum]|nr:hypothetical protein BHM03_00059459 [Ensete ventricosum]
MCDQAAESRSACSTPGDKATGGMTERIRRANQPAAPLTIGDWRHDRANATGQTTCSTPGGKVAGNVSSTIAMTWPAYNELAYAGTHRPLTMELAHADNLTGLTHHPTLRNDPNRFKVWEAHQSEDGAKEGDETCRLPLTATHHTSSPPSSSR